MCEIKKFEPINLCLGHEKMLKLLGRGKDKVLKLLEESKAGRADIYVIKTNKSVTFSKIAKLKKGKKNN